MKTLEERLRHLLKTGALALPFPGGGQTAQRHKQLAAIARENVALARMAEAHTDAVAILAEAGRNPHPEALYGVWASEAPRQTVRLEQMGDRLTLAGEKMFCTGAGIVDRALITVGPESLLIDVGLRDAPSAISFDCSSWKTAAFAETQTATTAFAHLSICETDIIKTERWYLDRPGFWHGACGPASCWAGGAMGLIDWATGQTRDEPHSLAHLGALKAAGWALDVYLDQAGREIDADPDNYEGARARALVLRHRVEQTCSDVLERFGRAYGPRPLAYDTAISQRYQELVLYLRQCHAERDLEALGRLSLPPPP